MTATQIKSEGMGKLKEVSLIAPREVVLGARAVMGAIDLDPYGTVDGNRLIQAARYYNRDQEEVDDICSREWGTSVGTTRVFLAPVGGARPSRRLLNKALRDYRDGRISECVIWLPHNESLIRLPWVWNFPICVPYRRFRPSWWDDETDEFRTVSPAFWSPVIYLPPTETPQLYQEKLMRFHAVFTSLGRVVLDESSGEDTWEEAYAAMTGGYFNYRA